MQALRADIVAEAKNLLLMGTVVYTDSPEEKVRAKKQGYNDLIECLCDNFKVTPMRMKQLLFGARFRPRDAYHWLRRRGSKLHHHPVRFRPKEIGGGPGRKVVRQITRGAYGRHSHVE